MKRTNHALFLSALGLLVSCGLTFSSSEGSLIVNSKKDVCNDEASVKIHNAEELQNMETLLDGEYCLVEDIDLAGSGFTPIATNADPFIGVLEGNNKTISNIDLVTFGSYQGLFGVLGSSAEIRNLTIKMESVAVVSSYAGVLAGRSSATISKVHIRGAGVIQGREYLGGLVGYQDGGSITQSSSTINMTKDIIGTSIGGLVGHAIAANIEDSYAHGITNGGSNVGGLIGYAESGLTVRRCYAIDKVNGSSSVGGLIGFMIGATLEGNYFDVDTTLQSTGVGSGSSSGVNGIQVSDISAGGVEPFQTTAGWDFENVWSAVGDASWPTLQ